MRKNPRRRQRRLLSQPRSKYRAFSPRFESRVSAVSRRATVDDLAMRLVKIATSL